MKKSLLYIPFILLSLTAFSQTAEQEKEMNVIISYVQETQRDDIFEVKNIRTQNDNNEEVITSYYFENENAFCIINKVYAKVQHETTYYLKDNKLILAIIREDSTKPDEIYYFVKNDSLLNSKDINEAYPFEEVVGNFNELISEF